VGAVRATSGGDAVWHGPRVVARVTGGPWVPPVVSGSLGGKEPRASRVCRFKNVRQVTP